MLRAGRRTLRRRRERALTPLERDALHDSEIALKAIHVKGETAPLEHGGVANDPTPARALPLTRRRGAGASRLSPTLLIFVECTALPRPTGDLRASPLRVAYRVGAKRAGARALVLPLRGRADA